MSGSAGLLSGLLIGWIRGSRRAQEAERVERWRESFGGASPSGSGVGIVEAPQEEIPLRIGATRLAFQFSSLLPQVHLTLISALQGVALATLVDKANGSFSLSMLPAYAASIGIIALVWYQYVNAFVTFLWPFWSLHALLQFVLAAVEVAAFTSISNMTHWLFGLAAMGVVGAFIRLVNTWIVSAQNYESEDVYVLDMGLEKQAAWQLLLSGLGVAALASLRVYLVAKGSVWLDLFDITVAVLLVVIVLFLLWIGDKATTSVLQRMLDRSRWMLHKYQIVERP